MPADTTVGRDDAILVVIDVQDRLAAAMERREAVLASTSRLVRTATLVGAPIVVTRQYPKGLGETEASLAAELARVVSDGARVAHVDKVAFDCFGEPAFTEAVERSDRRQLVIAGMETHICVTQTALSALSAGFDVHVVAGACCSRDAASHELALARLRRAGVVVTTAESVMYELVGEAATDEFRALLAIVKE